MITKKISINIYTVVALRVRANTKNSNTMSGPNNISNDYNNICQSSFPEGFNFDSPINMAINLQAQPHTQGFRPSTAFPLSRNVSTNTMDYGNIGNYTGDYASYQGNPSVSHFHPGNVDTVNG